MIAPEVQKGFRKTDRCEHLLLSKQKTRIGNAF